MTWTDERIADRFTSVEARLRRMDDLPDRMTRIEERLGPVAEDAAGCLARLDALTERLAERENMQRKERQSDRRWLIGSALTAAGLVIAALGILADKL